jgi:hypothetical protein
MLAFFDIPNNGKVRRSASHANITKSSESQKNAVCDWLFNPRAAGGPPYLWPFCRRQFAVSLRMIAGD